MKEARSSLFLMDFACFVHSLQRQVKDKGRTAADFTCRFYMSVMFVHEVFDDGES